MTCEIFYHAVPDGHGGPMKAVNRCATHGVDMPGAVTADTLCPIGKLERAAEDALKKIRAALDE